MTPSMKQGIYDVYILLGNDSGLATIKAASCECAAGYVLYVRVLSLSLSLSVCVCVCVCACVCIPL